MAAAIEVANVTKSFKVYQEGGQSAKERLIRAGRNPHIVFKALDDVSFEVAEGETFALLGHNGSGKSTLLKCISGILKPTTGTIRIRGRIASLLELGAGFHPELTGRENVFINAAFLGISRAEIARRFDDIVDFAELHEFIDEPVKHYSSGMYVRLGFAVAINLDPDILLVDEVLAVGDEVFQQKCLDRVRQFQQEGRTIVVVTHAADVVRQVCQRAIVLHHGEKVADTRPGEAIRIFREHLQGALSEAAVPSPDAPVRIDDLEIHSSGQEAKTITSGDPLELTVVFTAQRRLERPVVHVSIISPQGQTLYAIDIDLSDHGIGALDGTHRITASFARIPLLDGRYMVSTRVFDQTASEVAAVRVGRDEFSVLNPGTAHGVVSLKLDSVTAD